MGRTQQIFTTVIASTISLLSGSVTTWPSYSIYQNRSNITVLTAPMSLSDDSLLGALPFIGSMFGVITIKYLMDKIGRKNAGLAIAVPFMLSWCIIQVSTSSEWIQLARLLAGVSSGTSIVYCTAFAAEIADDSIRGVLTSVPFTFFNFGIMSSYLIGWFLPHRAVVWINLCISVLLAFLIMTVVESPVFFAKKGYKEDALVSIAYYKGAGRSSKIVQEEYYRLKRLTTPDVELLPNEGSSSYTELDSDAKNDTITVFDNTVTPKVHIKTQPLRILFTTQSFRRIFIILLVTTTLQVLMGMLALQVYAYDIFVKSAPKLSPHSCAIYLATVCSMATLTTSVLTDIVGRRILLLTSAALVAILMAALGILIQTDIASAWLNVLLMLLYCYSFNVGVGSIPYVLQAECFSPEIQTFASTILVEWQWFISFFVISLFPYVNLTLGMCGTFYIFSVFGALSTVVIYFFIPETKGLSIEQIQEVFTRKIV